MARRPRALRQASLERDMPRDWETRSIEPLHLPFRDGRTYIPDLQVECRGYVGSEDGPLPITASPVWQIAPLTRTARRIIPARYYRALEIRRVGETEPCAIVVAMYDHRGALPNYWPRGKLVSARPERARFRRREFACLATADLVVVSSVPICELGSILIGTRPERRRGRLPEEDGQALADLAF